MKVSEFKKAGGVFVAGGRIKRDNATRTETPEEKEAFDAMTDKQVSAEVFKNMIERETPVFTQSMAYAGELPEVGSEIIVTETDSSSRLHDFNGVKVRVLGVNSCNTIPRSSVITFAHRQRGIGCGIVQALKKSAWFKPTPTERDIAIDDIKNILISKVDGNLVNLELGCRALYDAGYRPQLSQRGSDGE